MDEEIWKTIPVPGFVYYEVSNLGRVRSYRRGADRMLKPGLTSVGYYSVALGRGNTKLVHRLVAEAFIGPCPVGQEVRHKDGSRTNNRADNLEYGTRSENIADAIAHGTYQKGRDKMRKVRRSCHFCIKALYAGGGYTYKAIGEMFGVSEGAILYIVRGRTRASIR